MTPQFWRHQYVLVLEILAAAAQPNSFVFLQFFGIFGLFAIFVGIFGSKWFLLVQQLRMRHTDNVGSEASISHKLNVGVVCR